MTREDYKVEYVEDYENDIIGYVIYEWNCGWQATGYSFQDESEAEEFINSVLANG